MTDPNAIDRKEGWCLLTFLCLMAGVAMVTSVLKYMTLGANAYDLGLFDTALWWASQTGHMYTPVLKENLLHHHFMPILWLLVPFYLVDLGGPIFLVAVQSALLFAASIPFYFIARNILKVPLRLACVATALMVLSPGFANAALFDFHPETVLPLLMLSLFYCLHQRRWAVAVLLSLLILGVKENCGLYVAAVGLAAFTQTKDKKPLALGAGGLVFFLILYGVAVKFGYFAGARDRYGWLGGGIGPMLGTLCGNPWLVLKTVFVDHEGGSYLNLLLLPLLYLPLLSPRLLLPLLPGLALNLLADYDLGRELKFHYQVELIPWLYLGALSALQTIHRALKKLVHQGLVRRGMLSALCTLLLVVNLLHADKYGRLLPLFDEYEKNRLQMENLLCYQEIGWWASEADLDGCTLAATNSLIQPCLTHRMGYQVLGQSPVPPQLDFYLFDTQRLHWDKATARTLEQLERRLSRDPHYQRRLLCQRQIIIYSKRLNKRAGNKSTK